MKPNPQHLDMTMPCREIRSKSIIGLDDNASPNRNTVQKPIVREVEIPKGTPSDKANSPELNDAKQQTASDPIAAAKEKLFFIRQSRLITKYGWLIFGIFLALIWALLIWIGVFGNVSNFSLPGLYDHLVHVFRTNLLFVVSFTMAVQVIFIGFMVPGVTLFQIVFSHLSNNFVLSFLLQFVAVNLSIVLIYAITTQKAKVYCLKKFERDLFYKGFKAASKKFPLGLSIFCWMNFIPYNYKAYMLSLFAETTFVKFYLPAVPFVAVHSAIFAYLGISIPHLTSTHAKSQTMHLSAGSDKYLILSLILVIFGTKLLCFFQGIIRSINNYRHKRKQRREEDCASKCSDDAKTCVSLNLTLESCSHIRQLANVPVESELEMSLDSIVVNKGRAPQDAMSCLPGKHLPEPEKGA